MKKDQKPFTLILTVLAAIVLFFLMCIQEQLFVLQDRIKILTALCNAFFVPGILLVGLGALLWLSNGGVFDIVAYSTRNLLTLLNPFRKSEKHETYFDFKTRKESGRQKQQKPILIYVGLVMILLACVCLILYYRA